MRDECDEGVEAVRVILNCQECQEPLAYVSLSHDLVDSLDPVAIQNPLISFSKPFSFLIYSHTVGNTMPLSKKQLEAWGHHFEAKAALQGTDFWAWWDRNPHLHSQAPRHSQTSTGLLTPTHENDIAQPITYDFPRPQRPTFAWPSNSPCMLTPDRETPETYQEPGEQRATPDMDLEDDDISEGPPDRNLRSQTQAYGYWCFFELRWNGRRAKPTPIRGCEGGICPPDEYNSSEGESETLQSSYPSKSIRRSHLRRPILSRSSGIVKDRKLVRKRKRRTRS